MSKNKTKSNQVESVPETQVDPVFYNIEEAPTIEIDLTKESTVKINQVGLNQEIKIPICPICHFKYPDEILGHEIVCRNCGNKVKTV